MMIFRFLFALAATVLAAWCLRAGLPLAAVAVVALAVSIRHAAESGRLAGFARRTLTIS